MTPINHRLAQLNAPAALRWGGIVLLLLLLFISYQQLQKDDVLPLRELHISGADAHVEIAEVTAAAQPLASTGFFAVDLQAVQRSVESLPWVKAASVGRVWPDRLTIKLQEQQAYAAWCDADGELQGLINAEFELFLTVASSAERAPLKALLTDSAPRFCGPAEQVQQLAENWQSWQAELATVNEQLAEVAVSERGDWRLQLRSGLQLRLGLVPVDERLQRFLRLKADVAQPLTSKLSQVAYLDLRYPHGLAIGWLADRRRRR